jgi:heptosyltransferase-2
VRKVLVIRLSSLGDVVLTTPVYPALKNAWPDAHVTSLVKEDYADVLAGNTSIDHVMVLKRGESILSLARRVRSERFDIIIDLHSNLRSRLVTLFSSAKRKIHYRKAALARRMFVRWRISSAELRRHVLERYWSALSAAGVPVGAFPRGADPIRRMVLIQTAFLGDAVLTTPLIQGLRTAYPEAHLSLVCTPETADVFAKHPGISEVITYDKRGSQRSFPAMLRFAGDLRKRRFDAAFVPHRSMRSALLAWLAGIPRRIGFSSSQGKLFLTDIVPFEWGVHDVERNLALLKAVGAEKYSGGLSLSADADAGRIVEERFSAEGIIRGERILGINAGSVWATKRWLPERFAEVADRAVRDLGAKVVFFGGLKDRPAVEAVRRAMKENAVDWSGKTLLRELIAAISRCSVFLTNDSGPMHIAVAGQVPVVAIFGPTTKELGFFPYGNGHVVIEKDLKCRPCGLHGSDRCPLGHFECMKRISTEEVFAAVRQQWEKEVSTPSPLAGEGKDGGTPPTSVLPLEGGGR